MMNQDQDKILITKQGLVEIKEEYQGLLEEKRPILVDRLAEARGGGDLSENSEYLQAKEELAFLDGRIEELAEVIGAAKVVDNSHGDCQQAGIGCRVVIENDNQQQDFYLVGEWEANPAEKKISHQSPLGQALVGKKIGDQVEFEAPAGKIVYTIKEIN